MSSSRNNVVDDKGVNRLVSSNQDKMPLPIIAGKDYKRRVAPAAIIMYDEKGDKVGGVGLSAINQSGIRALAFDFANADAIGLLAQEDLKCMNFKAGILINDKDVSG
jgi:hypothetical protein